MAAAKRPASEGPAGAGADDMASALVPRLSVHHAPGSAGVLAPAEPRPAGSFGLELSPGGENSLATQEFPLRGLRQVLAPGRRDRWRCQLDEDVSARRVRLGPR